MPQSFGLKCEADEQYSSILDVQECRQASVDFSWYFIIYEPEDSAKLDTE